VIALVFSYEVSDPREFERVYGTGGEWSEFFRPARGYIGTELLHDLEHPDRYLVIDRWESAAAYDAFVAANREEYMRRVDETVFLYQQELRLGTFESVF
jgi:heme-degrading monooxygenase HmoA